MKISVTMAAYNTERFVAAAVESILAQTYRDFELIIVDDGSTDSTLSILRSYAARDSRVRVFSKPHGGISAARNYALEKARGEWIAVMDADDVCLPQRLERQLAFVEANPDVAVVSAYVYNIDDQDRIIAQYRSPLASREVVQRCIQKNVLISFHHPAVLMRRDAVMAVGGYRSQFDAIEDCDLWNRIAELGHGLLVQPEFLVKYRIHGKSVSVARVRQLALKRRWLHDCMLHRRRGEAEPTWEAFMAARQRMPWTTRFSEDRRDLSWILYKQAVSAYVQKSPHRLATNLAGALLLNPKQMSHRIWHRYLQPALTGRAASSEDEPDAPDFPHATI
ncbi:MAG: glycosyltransferase family 2 protein [Kiloniellales bacterium]